MAGRSVVRDDATAAVPSSQWRPSRLLDAEYPDELPRGLGTFSRKSCLTNLQRRTVVTSHHHTDSRSQKPPSARLDAPHPPGFVRAYSEYVSRGAHKETAVKETATTRRHRPSLAASPQSRPRAHSRAHQWRSGAAQPPSASAAAPSPAPAVPVWKRAPAVHSLPFSHSNILLPDTPRTSARAVMSERLVAACCVVSRATAVRRRRRHRRRSPSASPPPPLPRVARHLHLPPHPICCRRAGRAPRATRSEISSDEIYRCESGRTSIWRPRRKDSLKSWMAFAASRVVEKRTVPQPRDRPSASTMTSAWTTLPAARKWSLRACHQRS